MKKFNVLFFILLVSTLSLASNASAFSMSFQDLRLSSWSGLTSWDEAQISSRNSIVVDFKNMEDTENSQPEPFQIIENVDTTEEYVFLDPNEITITPEGSEPVPEPASMILLGLGLSAFAAFKRSKNPKKG